MKTLGYEAENAAMASAAVGEGPSGSAIKVQEMQGVAKADVSPAGPTRTQRSATCSVL